MDRTRANETAEKVGLTTILPEELAYIKEQGLTYEEYATELRDQLTTLAGLKLAPDFEDAIVYFLSEEEMRQQLVPFIN